MNCPSCGYAMSAFDTVCPRCQGKGAPQGAPKPPPAAPPPSSVPPSPAWHYAFQGSRLGPVAQSEIVRLIAAGTITPQTPVWCQGMTGWQPAQTTHLYSLFATAQTVPPPLMGDEVSNNLVWVIAFAPMIGVFLSYMLAAMTGSPAADFWWVFIILNISLCLADESHLKKAGHDTNGMGVWAVLLVPVYLFVRAGRLKQSNAYGFVWLGMFVLSLFC